MASARPRGRPGGAAAQILNWLGSGRRDGDERRERRPVVSRPRHPMATARSRAAPLRTALRSSAADAVSRAAVLRVRQGARAVNALRLGDRMPKRTASPCSPPARTKSTVAKAVRAATAVRAAGAKVATVAKSKKRKQPSPPQIEKPFEEVARARAASPSSHSSSLEEIAEATEITPPTKSRSVANAKLKKIPRTQEEEVTPPPSPASVASSSADPTLAPPLLFPTKVHIMGTSSTAQVEEGTFQAAVLDRLQNLCGEHEDAKVLAEYIVVMVAGNKGRVEMALELKPFFQDKKQADSFVEWVEETKWKFLTGGPSPVPGDLGGKGSEQAPAQASGSMSGPLNSRITASTIQQRLASSVAGGAAQSVAHLAGNRKALLTPNLDHQGSQVIQTQPAVRPGPHVAVTSRCVLQPNPNFDASPPHTFVHDNHAQSLGRQAAPAHQSTHTRLAAIPTAFGMASPAQIGNPSFSKASSVATLKSSASAIPIRREKNELLESMTKQLQMILTKLNDKGLADDTREKYQTMAQSIQLQMAKISKPPPVGPPVRRRRLS